jgi:hypothetical protein
LALTVFALLVALVAALAGIVYAARKGLQFWRDLKAGLGAFGDTMDELGGKLDALAAYEPPEVERVSESVQRLQRSAAQLSVLVSAVDRVREQWEGLLVVYPRK